MLRRSNNPVLPRLSAVEILLLNGFGHRAKGGCTAFTELSLPPTCIDTNHKNESTKCSLQKKTGSGRFFGLNVSFIRAKWDR